MEQRDHEASEIPTFLDATDRVWEVREICEPLLPERRRVLAAKDFASGWLLFTCGAERRRLAPLPPDWREAPAEQLRRWCEDASPARPLA